MGASGADAEASEATVVSQLTVRTGATPQEALQALRAARGYVAGAAAAILKRQTQRKNSGHTPSRHSQEMRRTLGGVA